MRRIRRKSSETAALSLLKEAPAIQLATTTLDGSPVLRVLNHVLTPSHVLFHGAIAGEKAECLGRPAVVSAYREIVDIPSYFTDSNKACPATTYYRSVQVHGLLEEVTDAGAHAAMLQALMDKYQPEGGYTPLRPEEALYKKDFRSVRVFGVTLDRVEGKLNLGQDKPQEVVHAVLEGLWRRGNRRDLEAIREILEESPHPWPLRFQAPNSTELLTAPREQELEQAADLLVGQYWRNGQTRDEILRSLEESDVWVGARDEAGRVVAMARAFTDTAFVASIHDVIVAPEHRGRRLGRTLMELLLDHPRLRHVRHIRLGTQDRQNFYRALGFQPASEVDVGFSTTTMLRCTSR